MCAGPARVTEPDSVVLDCSAVLLDKFDAVKNFSGGLLHFAKLVHVVPELGLGDDFVAGEEADGVNFGVGLLLGGQFAAQHKVLSNLS